MEKYPMKLEENFEQLKLLMEALGRLRDPEFQILQYEYRELRRGFNTNNWNARLKLNSKVIKLFSDVKASQERDNARSVSVETLRREVAPDRKEAETDKPKRFSSGDHSSFTSGFSGKMVIDKGSSAKVETLIMELTMDKPRRFSYEAISSLTSDFSSKIGFGAFGNVYKGQFPDGPNVAVKVLVQNQIIEKTFIAEVITMGKTYHRNLIKLYGFCFDKNMKALVYEYMENGSLDRLLYEEGSSVDWKKLYGIAIETARGLSYLHEDCIVKIIHHDVKPANVLLDSNYSPKITDFGLANLIDENKTHITLSGARGTYGYVAPEVLQPYSQVTQKCDVYSFGMLLFDMLKTGSNNQRSQKWFPKQVWTMFEMGKLDHFIDDCFTGEESRKNAKTLATVALWCVQWYSAKRPRMSTVVKMLEKEIPVPVPPNPLLGAAESSVSVKDEDFY